jgi:hypothetical protein
LLKVALNTKTHNPDFDNNKKYFENLAIWNHWTKLKQTLD